LRATCLIFFLYIHEIALFVILLHTAETRNQVWSHR